MNAKKLARLMLSLMSIYYRVFFTKASDILEQSEALTTINLVSRCFSVLIRRLKSTSCFGILLPRVCWVCLRCFAWRIRFDLNGLRRDLKTRPLQVQVAKFC